MEEKKKVLVNHVGVHPLVGTAVAATMMAQEGYRMVESDGGEARAFDTVDVATNARRDQAIKRMTDRRERLDWNQKVENERLAKKAAKPRKVRKNEFRKDPTLREMALVRANPKRVG